MNNQLGLGSVELARLKNLPREEQLRALDHRNRLLGAIIRVLEQEFTGWRGSPALRSIVVDEGRVDADGGVVEQLRLELTLEAIKARRERELLLGK